MADPVDEPADGDAHPPSRARSAISKILDGVLWLAVLGVLALALFPKNSGPGVGQPATALTLQVIGETAEPRAVPGDLERPLLIEAFASWCGACRRNAGLLTDLQSAQDEGLLDVVAISVDDRAEKALLAKKSWPITVDVLHDGSGTFAREYKVDVLPTYILVGVDGKVKRVTSGTPGASDIRAWVNEGQ